MTDYKKLICQHFDRYPCMKIRDFAKLLYQNEFGCEHLILDKESALSRISDERKNVVLSDTPHIESIGNGYYRLYLSSPYLDDTILSVFMASGGKTDGTKNGFLEKYNVLKELCLDGTIPYSVSDAEEFISQWCDDGCMPLSHSDSYKSAYNPAYRVVLEKYVPLLPIIDAIFARRGQRTVVSIDGRCGAGKTTLATMLSSLFNCTPIHMDDFFLPPTMRTKNRLSEAGGNIHYERFYDEVVKGIKSGQPFSYGVFDCSRMEVIHTVQVDHLSLIIVEGSYSQHPYFQTYADITVFCDVSCDIQETRILKRNGKVMYEQFKNRWIPMEEAYFSAFDIKEKCDFLVTI